MSRIGNDFNCIKLTLSFTFTFYLPNKTLQDISPKSINLFFFTDLLVDMLGVLASYNVTVRELKLYFSKLQGEQGQWVNRTLH